ncbi:MAG: hypothetical protein HRT38_07145 [Alteromonadaceae bacterium]|nr:hypothetical protein [Alteromonadaceae bacterium]
MKFSFISNNFRQEWLLHSSALFTWSLITYASLRNFELGFDLFWRSITFLSFIVLFFYNTDRDNNKSDNQTKAIVCIQVLIIWILISVDVYNLAPILLCLVSSQLPGLFTRFQSTIFLLVVNIGYYFILTVSDPSRGIISVAIIFLLQVFAYSTLDIVRREKEAREKISAINQELIATRFMLKTSTEKQERLRISRDLHDILGHQLTALSLNLEVSMHKVPDEYQDMLKDNLQQAKNVLHNVRGVVKEMRSEDQFDLVNALNELFEHLPNCQLSIEKPLNVNSLSLKYQLMYCLQEGISNGLRHGYASQFNITCQRNNNIVILQLIDNGNGFINNNAGSGLTGMKERLAEFNGSVELLNNDIKKSASGCTLMMTAEDSYDPKFSQ